MLLKSSSFFLSPVTKKNNIIGLNSCLSSPSSIVFCCSKLKAGFALYFLFLMTMVVNGLYAIILSRTQYLKNDNSKMHCKQAT